MNNRWGQLHYWEEGAGDQTLVIIGETSIDWTGFKRLVPFLSDEYRLLVLDTPGYGTSDPPPAPASVEEYAGAFAEALEALNVDRCTLLGIHAGASYSLEIATAAAPERIESLVLSGVPAYSEADRLKRHNSPHQVWEYAADGSHMMKSFQRIPSTYDPQNASQHAASAWLFPDRAFWGYYAVYSYRAAETLAKVKQPLLFVSTPLDPLWPSDELGMTLAEHAEQVVIETDVTPLYWTKPEETAQAIKAFMSKARA